VLGEEIYKWLLLFQEYDFEVIVRPDHLSRIDNGEEPTNIDEGLPDVQLFTGIVVDEHFAGIIYFLTTSVALEGYAMQQKKELVVRVLYFSVILDTYIRWEQMKFYTDMYLNMNDIVFWLKCMVVSQEDIMQVRKLHRRFCE